MEFEIRVETCLFTAVNIYYMPSKSKLEPRRW